MCAGANDVVSKPAAAPASEGGNLAGRHINRANRMIVGVRHVQCFLVGAKGDAMGTIESCRGTDAVGKPAR